MSNEMNINLTNQTNTNTLELENNSIDTSETIDNECDGGDCDCEYSHDGYDSDHWSDTEEYHQFIDSIDNKFMNFKSRYENFCNDTGREVNPMEMFAFMDILQGGSGKMICLAGEKDIAEKDRKYVQTMEEWQQDQDGGDGFVEL